MDIQRGHDRERREVDVEHQLEVNKVATRLREARLDEPSAAGWSREPFAEFWAAPDLEWVPSIRNACLVARRKESVWVVR